jgi:hypothetical protein
LRIEEVFRNTSSQQFTASQAASQKARSMSDIANSRLKPGVKEKFSVSRAAPLQFGRFALLPIMELKPDPSNPRKHGREQIRAIARSIAAFGFNAPILIDRNK